MLTLRSILCPVDFSDQSQHALRWGVALAARHQSQLHVLTAVDPLLAQAAKTRFSLDLPKAEMEPALREFVKTALPSAAAWVPTTNFHVSVGEAAEVILETADRERADLLVMGTHGLGGFRKLLLGSTTERVLRRTRIPLLAVPSLDSASGNPILELDADGPRFTMKTIVMATDFSEASADAVHWAADVAQRIQIPVVLVHVVTPVTVPAQWRSFVVDEVHDEHELRARLEQVAAGLLSGIPHEVFVSVGRPADSIATLAEERGAGLIVMGLFGHQGTFAPRPGSIAYRVVSLAHVPVLVVPPRAQPNPVSLQSSG
jgi:nucleotide-binding universal stress UspA family protein